jgi:hypothetical protein
MRTVVLSEAVVTSLGAGCLLYGDRQGVLRHPYYPDYERLGPGEADEALRWHRFSLRCRDLFSGGTDTSWYDLGDENGATSVAWGGAVSCEPLGGALFARVRRSPDLVAVSLVDLTGNKDGCWSSPSGPGRSQEASVTVLVDSLDGWRVEIATVGSHQGRFVPVEPRPVEHREGRALEVGVPLGDGWSVLRMTRRP